MNRLRQWLNDRWQLFLPVLMVVTLLAGWGFIQQGRALRRAQAAGDSKGCGSGRLACKLAEVGGFSLAQFAVRQWVQKKYGENAAIQFAKPEPIGNHWQVRVVVNNEVSQTLLVDAQGSVREKPASAGKASVGKENKP